MANLNPIPWHTKKSRIALAILSLVLLSTAIYLYNSPRSFRITRIIRDHAVLQRDKPMPIWGWGKSGSTVWVRLRDLTSQTSKLETYKAIVDENGEWKLSLKPHAAGGPYRLSVIAQLNYIQYDDIVFGDVWLCSGQSNMELQVKYSDGAAEAMEVPFNPNIRYFGVSTEGSKMPRKEYRWGKWKLDDPSLRNDFSALPYYFAKALQRDLDLTIGLVNASIGSSRIEAWLPPECFGETTTANLEGLDFSNMLNANLSKDSASQLYNSMVHPVHNFPFKGIIWWQGESNTEKSDAANYQAQFQCLIEKWREAQGDSLLPFLYVQLANIGPRLKNKKKESDWPRLREAQSLVSQQVSKTAQVVIFDICPPADIHPPNKKDIAERLALAARNVAYGEQIAYAGPVFQAMKPAGNRLRLHFNAMGGGLVAKPSESRLKGFVVAGPDQLFHPAQAIIEGNTILVWSEEVSHPIAARYAWERSPLGSNLYNGEGLPASPFRTDRW